MSLEIPLLLMQSHLTRGAWIEIAHKRHLADFRLLSHLTRGAWIEIVAGIVDAYIGNRRTSHEVRGLKWHIAESLHSCLCVAPHTRCVD